MCASLSTCTFIKTNRSCFLLQENFIKTLNVTASSMGNKLATVLFVVSYQGDKCVSEDYAWNEI